MTSSTNADDAGQANTTNASNRTSHTNSPQSLDYDSIINQARSSHPVAPPLYNGVATEAIVKSVATALVADNNMVQSETNINKAKLSIAVLAQEGATSPRFNESRRCDLFGIPISVANLRKHAKANSTTVRALARALRKEAIKVASSFNIEGNLSKTYKLQHPDAQKSDLYWVSDFQSFSDDAAMPENIRTWLLQNYANRFASK